MESFDAFCLHYQHGLWGLPYPSDVTALPCYFVNTDEEQGPIELLFVNCNYIPRFENATVAYEAGRSLRMVGYILDRMDTELTVPHRLLEQLVERDADSTRVEPIYFWTSKSVCLAAKEAVGLSAKDYLTFERSILGYSKDRPDVFLSEMSR